MHKLFDLVRIANDLNRKLCVPGYLLSFPPKLFVLTGQEDCLHIEFARDQFAKDIRDITAADPACIYKNGELVWVKPECRSRVLCIHLIRFPKFGMQRQPGDLYFVGRNTIVYELSSGVLISHKIKRNIIACPPFPKTVAGIGNDRYERYLGA